MPGDNPEIGASRKIELAVSQCESISILPSVASRFLSQLDRMELTPGSLSELIESDPAICVLVLKLCHNKGIIIKQCDTWLLQIMEAISLREIRSAILSAQICGGIEEDEKAGFRKELTRHSLACACCAKEIAALVTPVIDGDTAYLAGLLHDIGKFLLDEVMPKSFDTLLEQAKADKKSFSQVEQINLGLDHTILGKRFAQKLRLPSDIILGIWLHHSRAGAIPQMPQARIAAIVELADSIVLKAGFGESGSYQQIEPSAISSSLGLSDDKIKQIEQQLPDKVRQKSEAVGLNILKPGWAYCDAVRNTAGQLALDSSKLYDESTRLQSSASSFDFVNEMMPQISSYTSAIEFAENFAINWQNFYHTGPVCIYIKNDAQGMEAEAAVIDEKGKANTIILKLPNQSALPAEGINDSLIDAGTNSDWLFEQCDVRFDSSRTKIIPMESDKKTAGMLLFELRHPAGADFAERIAPIVRFGANIIDMISAIGNQQWYAERFAQALTDRGQRAEDGEQKKDIESNDIKKQVMNTDGMIEMAAGAAHELNNPLSVISGRAQLLAKSETDPDRKRILEQIQQNAGEISGVIDSLMSYANPEKPKPTKTEINQIINEAVDLTIMKKQLSSLDAKIEIPADIPAVLVDSAQVASAISNIICNALESYQTGKGEIAIKAAADNNTITIEIIDSGKGMDAQTLVKATQPFFSLKSAGRKRGMGLAHAQRLIEINHGNLSMKSETDKGTTAKISLPRKP